jgi:Flp pilus assembly pilin Flp
MINQISVLKTWADARLHIGENEDGANLVEYILLVAFIALLVIGAVVALKGAIQGKFNGAQSCLDSASAATEAGCSTATTLAP